MEQQKHKKQPKISVVIPVYNAQKYLRECLDSVLAQSLTNIEIICVDDGSTDDSLLILEEYRKRDDRIRIYKQVHQYAGVARNYGIEQALGDYIIFWDADDFFEPDCLLKMYNRAEKTQADIVICESNIYDNVYKNIMPWDRSVVSKFLPSKEVFSVQDISDSIFQLGEAWSWDKLFKVSFVRENKLQYLNTKSAEDVNFVFTAMAVAKRIAIVKERLVNYRKFNMESLENTKKDCWRNTIIMYDCFYAELLRRGVWGQVQRSFDNFIVGHMLTVLTMLGAYEEYCKMVWVLKEEVINKYQLLEHESDYFYNPQCYEQIRMMSVCTPEKYLMKDMIWRFGDLERASCAITAYETGVVRAYDEVVHVMKKKNWMFPWNRLPYQSEVVIYGAGDVGQDFYRQLSESRYCKVIGWVDQNYKRYEQLPLQVSAPEKLLELKYDVVIIAVMDKHVAEIIKCQLSEMGISDKKLIWEDLLESDIYS